MSDHLVELAQRKRLLVARSQLHRLELQHGLGALRHSLTQPKNLLSMATSGPARPLVFGVLMMLVGRGRLGGILRGALMALTVAKAVRAFTSRPRD